MSKKDGIIGISDHGGWAVLVTVASDGTMLDRRRVELVDEGMPKIPHHSEGQGLPIHEAVALVEVSFGNPNWVAKTFSLQIAEANVSP